MWLKQADEDQENLPFTDLYPSIALHVWWYHNNTDLPIQQLTPEQRSQIEYVEDKNTEIGDFLRWMKNDGYRFIAAAPGYKMLMFSDSDDYNIVQCQYSAPNEEQLQEFMDLITKEFPQPR